MYGKQYSIGEFASLNKVTARMLRHYEKKELLNPAAILENGYRAYTFEQIDIVSTIRRYQACGFSLSEIKSLLDAEQPTVEHAAKTKLGELSLAETDHQNARMQLSILAGEQPSAPGNYYDISYLNQSERILLTCAEPVREAEIEAAIQKLYQVVEEEQNTPTNGYYMLLVDLEQEENYKVSIEVASPLSREGYECTKLPSGWYLSTIHQGDYYNIGHAYDRLLSFAKEKGHSLKPPFFEKYIIDEEKVPSCTQYLTQIFIQLTS